MPRPTTPTIPRRLRAPFAAARAASLLPASALLLAGLMLGARPAAAQGFDAAQFAAFLEAQGGARAPQVYAYTGTVYDVPSGRVLAQVDGYQLARLYRDPRDPNVAHVVRRAFLLYRDAERSRTLRVYPEVRASQGVAAAPLAIVRYRLEGDRVTSTILAGAGGQHQRFAIPETLEAWREGGVHAFRRVLAPPHPVEQPLEVVETRVHRAARDAADRVRVSMTKVANNPDFLPAGGRHLLHLNWRPVAGRPELAASVREFLEREAPAMGALPPTLEAAFAELGVRD